MAQPILRYPDGITGAALLLLRLSGAVIAFPSFDRLLSAPRYGLLAAIPSLLLAIALVGGIVTRGAAMLLASVLAANLAISPGVDFLFSLASAGCAAAVVLLGPGAYSIDAHRFGRRVIKLEPRTPDRGGPN